MKFSEDELVRISTCGVMPQTERSMLSQAAEATFRWGLLERFTGAVPKSQDIRNRFTVVWNKLWGSRSKEVALYWTGPRFCVQFGYRFYRFLLTYECMRPFEPYALDFPSGTITGSTAIVSHKKYRTQEITAYVLDLTERSPAKHRPALTDPRALSRWLAIRDMYDSPALGIVHFPLLSGESWKDESVDEPLAKSWVSAILEQAAKTLVYPRPGTHCRKCSMPCEKVIHG